MSNSQNLSSLKKDHSTIAVTVNVCENFFAPDTFAAELFVIHKHADKLPLPHGILGKSARDEQAEEVETTHKPQHFLGKGKLLNTLEEPLPILKNEGLRGN